MFSFIFNKDGVKSSKLLLFYMCALIITDVFWPYKQIIAFGGFLPFIKKPSTFHHLQLVHLESHILLKFRVVFV